MGRLDEVLLLVKHLDVDRVGPSIGRNELKQELPFAIIALYILVGAFSFGSGFLDLVALDPDLPGTGSTLHLRYS